MMKGEEARVRELARALPGSTVLQVLPSLADNLAARTAVNIAAALLRAGARAMIAAGGGALVGELQALGGEWTDLAIDSSNPLKVRRNAQRLVELMTTEQVDLVHAYTGPAAWSARIAARRTGARFMTTYSGAPPSLRGFALLYQRALAHGSRVIVDSGFAADLIAERHGVPADRIVSIPPSIDTARYDPAAVSGERIAMLRHAWHLRPEARVILVPGSLIAANGQMTVVDAARLLVNGGMRGVVFVITGDERFDARFTRALAERIRAQGLGGIVRRVGLCADMPAAYALAEIVVIASIEAATFDPLAAEAQAMACTVIASSVGVLPEIVLAPPHVLADDRTGWLFTPEDPVDLARAIAAALSTPAAMREEVGARARRSAERLFSPMRVAAATLAVYTSLLEGEN
jgi:glycosyltransferase involved in cell wall biosynthesis